MEEQLTIYYGGSFDIPLSDLVDTIMNAVCSSRSGEELQTEVIFSLSFTIGCIGAFV